jgi:hypothetical protein
LFIDRDARDERILLPRAILKRRRASSLRFFALIASGERATLVVGFLSISFISGRSIPLRTCYRAAR